MAQGTMLSILVTIRFTFRIPESVPDHHPDPGRTATLSTHTEHNMPSWILAQGSRDYISVTIRITVRIQESEIRILWILAFSERFLFSGELPTVPRWRKYRQQRRRRLRGGLYVRAQTTSAYSDAVLRGSAVADDHRRRQHRRHGRDGQRRGWRHGHVWNVEDSV